MGNKVAFRRQTCKQFWKYFRVSVFCSLKEQLDVVHRAEIYKRSDDRERC